MGARGRPGHRAAAHVARRRSAGAPCRLRRRGDRGGGVRPHPAAGDPADAAARLYQRARFAAAPASRRCARRLGHPQRRRRDRHYDDADGRGARHRADAAAPAAVAGPARHHRRRDREARGHRRGAARRDACGTGSRFHRRPAATCRGRHAGAEPEEGRRRRGLGGRRDDDRPTGARTAAVAGLVHLPRFRAAGALGRAAAGCVVRRRAGNGGGCRW